MKIIREETFPGNKHGPHWTEGRTNKLWGGYGVVKSLFTSEERNKVGGEPPGRHNNKSSSRGWGRRGWTINPESKTKQHSSSPWWRVNLCRLISEEIWLLSPCPCLLEVSVPPPPPGPGLGGGVAVGGSTGRSPHGQSMWFGLSKRKGKKIKTP